MNETDANYDLPTGTAIGSFPYTIRKILPRQGGMSAVYLADVAQASQEKQTAQQVVIKIAKNTLSDNYNRSIRNEELILPPLTHSGIVKMLPILYIDNRVLGYRARASLAGDPWFCIFEYLPGGSMVDLITAAPNGLAASQIIGIFSELLKTLAYLHQRKIVHMDLKPSNILFRGARRWSYRQHEPVLIDFGVARLINQLSGSGTREYLSPERKSEVSVQAHPGMDIYSLGLIVCEMCTGQKIDNALPATLLKTYQRLEQIEIGSMVLGTLLREMLHENLGSRPTAQDILFRLAAVQFRKSWRERFWW